MEESLTNVNHEDNRTTTFNAGIILHFDPTILIEEGAQPSLLDHIQRKHFFICTLIKGDIAFFVPLESSDGPGRHKIDNDCLTQCHEKIKSGSFYYHKDQYWTIPIAGAIKAAALSRDRSTPEQRNYCDQNCLDEINLRLGIGQ